MSGEPAPFATVLLVRHAWGLTPWDVARLTDDEFADLAAHAETETRVGHAPEALGHPGLARCRAIVARVRAG